MLNFEFGTVVVVVIGILGLACVVLRKLNNPDMSGLKPGPEFTVLHLFDR